MTCVVEVTAGLSRAVGLCAVVYTGLAGNWAARISRYKSTVLHLKNNDPLIEVKQLSQARNEDCFPCRRFVELLDEIK